MCARKVVANGCIYLRHVLVTHCVIAICYCHRLTRLNSMISIISIVVLDLYATQHGLLLVTTIHRFILVLSVDGQQRFEP